MPEKVKLAHGEPVRAWGARAIYTPPKYAKVDYYSKRKADKPLPCYLDILFDRAGALGCTEGEVETETFIKWINKTALPALRAWCDKRWVSTDSMEVFVLHEGRYTFMATCNGSYGYMYIGCWEYPQAADVTWLKACKAWYGIRGGLATWNGGPISEVKVFETHTPDGVPKLPGMGSCTKDFSGLPDIREVLAAEPVLKDAEDKNAHPSA